MKQTLLNNKAAQGVPTVKTVKAYDVSVTEHFSFILFLHKQLARINIALT